MEVVISLLLFLGDPPILKRTSINEEFLRVFREEKDSHS